MFNSHGATSTASRGQFVTRDRAHRKARVPSRPGYPGGPGYGSAVFGWVDELTNWLSDVSGNWWFLAVIAVIAFLDSVIPIVPSETCVIIGGVAAGLGEYPLWAVIACGAAGAFLGDNTAYAIGRRASGRFERRAERKPDFARRLLWAKEQIPRRGGLLLITGRFIPGGRTVLTLSSASPASRGRGSWRGSPSPP